MKKLYIAAAALLLLCMMGFRQVSRPTTWEYKREVHVEISEKKLNELGAQGWELVATATSQDVTQFIFKRAK